MTESNTVHATVGPSGPDRPRPRNPARPMTRKTIEARPRGPNQPMNRTVRPEPHAEQRDRDRHYTEDGQAQDGVGDRPPGPRAWSAVARQREPERHPDPHRQSDPGVSVNRDGAVLPPGGRARSEAADERGDEAVAAALTATR